MPEPRYCMGVSSLGGLLYIVGGRSPRAGTLSSVQRYDPASNSWSTVAPMSTARTLCSAFVVDGCMYAAGGGTDEDGVVAEVEKYDPATDTWSAVAAMNTARAAHCTHAVRLEVNLFDWLMAKTANSQTVE